MSILHLFKQSLLTNIKCQYCYLNFKSFSRYLSNRKSNFQFTKIWKDINSNKFINTKSNNVNVVKDVILYNHINKNRTNIILLFGLSQGVFWTFTTHSMITELRDVPVNKEDSKNKGFFERYNFGELKWKLPLGTVCFLMALTSVGMASFYLTRLVTSIRLDKSGKTITILIAEDRWWRKEMMLPLNDISAVYSRTETKSFFPFRIKGKSFFYFIDLEEPIRNVALFDVTIGTKRKLN